jgi:tetratricopeptide (TPR) repeat protein
MRLIAAFGAPILAVAVVVVCPAVHAADSVEDLMARGNFLDALPPLEAARDVAVANGRKDREVATVFNNLGAVYDQLGRPREAETMYERSLAIRRDLGESETREAARTANNLGALYLKLGLPGKSREMLERAAAIDAGIDGRNGDEIEAASVWINLSVLDQSEHRWEEAETMLRKALAARERELGPNHRDVAVVLNDLGVLLQSCKRLAEAEPLLERALGIWQTATGEMHPWFASGLNNLALVYMGLGRPREAEERFKKALQIGTAVLPPNHPHLASYMTSYAQLLRHLGRKDEAKRMEQAALRSRENYRRENLLGFTVDAQRLRH